MQRVSEFTPITRMEGFLIPLRCDKPQQLLAEPEGLPEEYYPFVLQMIRTYRESILL